MKPIDFRSDTVTKPTEAMLEAMMKAPIGDDVYGEDPTVNLLEEKASQILGKEASIFCPSGTQSNLLALLTHCNRGDEYIVGQKAHTYMYEGGGAAVLGSIQPQPLDFNDDGTLDLEKVVQAIKPDDYHFACTKLLCLENTHMGKVLPMSYLDEAKQIAIENNLNLHLDGARIFNAAVKLEVDVKEISKNFDTVSFCLSKGLGTPVGSILCGRVKQIKSARKWRKMLGGGMRQAGILAAAGIYALDNNVERLAIDHDHAALFARNLSDIKEIDIIFVNTNIMLAKVNKDFQPFHEYLNSKGILISNQNPVRLVTHLDISKKDVLFATDVIKDYFSHR